MSETCADPYELLGVAHDASPQVIHEAYRRQARAWHPDLHRDVPEAGERFRAIHAAYQTLADPSQRRQYDAGLTQRPAAHADVQAEVTLGLKEVYVGTTVKVQVPHAEVCGGCQGSGSVLSASAGRCFACRGSGWDPAQNLLGVTVSSPCERCRGTGRSSAPTAREPCRPCKGIGWLLSTTTLEVRIPPGVDSGSRLRVPGHGQPILRGGRGDLLLTVKVRPGPWTRQGQDLTLDVPAPSALLRRGGHLPLHLPTTHLNLKVPRGARVGDRLRVPGQGIPAFGGNPQGDLFVRWVEPIVGP